MKRTLCALLTIILVFMLFPCSYAAADDTTAFSDDPKAIQAASNSVIMLSCYDKDGNLYATGSAFAAFEEGVFVTNCHVIKDEVYSIRASMETGLEFSIHSVVAYDADKDIAILRTEAKTGLDPLPLGRTAALERAEKVIAIGSPLGLINTISIGLYSGIIKDDRAYLQFSAPISHGSSGGALFNDRGEVVGITSASFAEGQNLNLAIPIEDAVELWEKRDDTELSIAAFYEEFTSKKAQASEKSIIFEIVHGNGSKKTYTIQTDAQYLRGALEEAGLISGDESEYGLYVETVDGETADIGLNQWWCLYKNQQMLMTGVDDTLIENGEHYEAVLTVGW